MRRGGEIAIAAAVLSVLGVAGCGGGSSSSQASTNAAQKASLTKQEWVDKANGICHASSDKKARQTEAFYKAHGVSGSPNQRQREAMIAAVILPNVQERIEALDALPAPPGEEAEIRAILRSMERGIHEAEAHPENLAIPKQPIPFAESEHVAGAYGLLFCGMP